jgi:hypothetical protein
VLRWLIIPLRRHFPSPLLRLRVRRHPGSVRLTSATAKARRRNSRTRGPCRDGEQGCGSEAGRVGWAFLIARMHIYDLHAAPDRHGLLAQADLIHAMP